MTRNCLRSVLDHLHLTKTRMQPPTSDAMVRRGNTPPVISARIVAMLEAGPCSENTRPLPNATTTLIGEWPNVKTYLVAHILKNLHSLAKTPKGDDRWQLQREMKQYWNCLSDAQKVEALATIGGQRLMTGSLSPRLTPEQAAACGLPETFADMTENDKAEALKHLTPEQKQRFSDLLLHGPAISWLHSTLTHAGAAERNRLFRFLDNEVQANLDTVVKKKPDRSFIDIGLDYKIVLKYRNIDGSLATLPPEAIGKRVAIIGSGVAGLNAAREALAMGLCPVIFEADDHIGGRMASWHFHDEDNCEEPEFAEMGAMRFPVTGRSWLHLLDKVAGIDLKPGDGKKDSAFPNPGEKLTQLLLGGKVINWPAGTPAPKSALLEKVKADFERFAESLLNPLEEARRMHGSKKMEEIWQNHIDAYKDKSFYAAVMDGMEKSGADWGEDEKNAFAALGIGTGGLGPVFDVGFLEILRVMVNKLDENQQLLSMGTTAALGKFYETAVADPEGNQVSLKNDAVLRLGTKVTGISCMEGTSTLTFAGPDGAEQAEQFDAVIVATTTRAMEHIKGLTSTTSDTAPLAKAVAIALPKLHMINSSKFFIRTEKKFWLDEDKKPRANIPQVILTDRGPCNVFCLDYPDTDHGIVALSYTWGDASTRLESMYPEERFKEFKDVLNEVNPEFAENLVPMNDEFLYVDWQRQEHQHGAFKLISPGQEVSQKEVYHHYLDVMSKDDKPHSGVFLAGCSVGYGGGWAESAVITSINAVLAMAHHFGGTPADDAPLKKNKDKFNYGK